MKEIKIKTLDVGPTHSAFVSEEGYCYMIGSNNFGQLGTGSFGHSDRLPHKITNIDRVGYVACGDAFTVAAAEGMLLFYLFLESGYCFFFSIDNPKVYTWGKQSRGRLGREDKNDSLKPSPVEFPLCGDEVKVQSLSSAHGSTLICFSRNRSP